MDYRQIACLENVTAAPAVTICVPTHRFAPDNEQDPQVVARQVDAAARKLQRSGHGAAAPAIVEAIRTAVAKIDWSATLDGLVIFAGASPRSGVVATVVHLPYKVKARVYVGDRFRFDDLPAARSDIAPHTVVHLTADGAVVYRATFADLDEVGTAARGDVDALSGLLADTPRQVVVLDATGGRNAWAAHLDRTRIIATVEIPEIGATSAGRRWLGEQAWVQVARLVTRRRNALLDELSEAHGAGRTVRGLAACAKAARAGKLAALYVEETFHADDGSSAVDELLAAARDADVSVHLFEHGTLSGWGHVVGVTR